VHLGPRARCRGVVADTRVITGGILMNRLCMIVAGLVLLGAGSAWADDASVVRTHSLEVKERLQHLELIEVTAEKPANPDAEPLDEELLEILQDAERDELAQAQRARQQ